MYLKHKDDKYMLFTYINEKYFATNDKKNKL